MSNFVFELVGGFFLHVRSKKDAIAWLVIVCIIGTLFLAFEHYDDKIRKQKKNRKTAIT